MVLSSFVALVLMANNAFFLSFFFFFFFLSSLWLCFSLLCVQKIVRGLARTTERQEMLAKRHEL